MTRLTKVFTVPFSFEEKYFKIFGLANALHMKFIRIVHCVFGTTLYTRWKLDVPKIISFSYLYTSHRLDSETQPKLVNGFWSINTPLIAFDNWVFWLCLHSAMLIFWKWAAFEVQELHNTIWKMSRLAIIESWISMGNKQIFEYQREHICSSLHVSTIHTHRTITIFCKNLAVGAHHFSQFVIFISNIINWCRKQP